MGIFLEDKQARVLEVSSGRTVVVKPEIKLLGFLKRLLNKNKLRNTQMGMRVSTELDVLMKIFFVLMNHLKASSLWQSDPAQFPSHLFATERSDFFNTERLGGLFTSIKKEYPIDLQELPQTALPIVELFHSVLQLAYLALSYQFRTYIYHRENAQAALADVKRLLEKHPDRAVELEKIQHFQNCVNSTRLLAWHSIALQDSYLELCGDQLLFVGKLLQFLSPTPIFPYLPVFYLRYFLDTASFLMRCDNLPPSLLPVVLRTIGQNFRHPHIILPDLKEQMLAIFYELINLAPALALMEEDYEFRTALMTSLMELFCSPQWPSSGPLLLGVLHGFGFGHDPDRASLGFRENFREYLNDAESRDRVILKCYDHLSWATSELMIALEEHGKLLNQPRVVRKQALTKSKNLADWIGGLLQILEVSSHLLPTIFEKKVTLARLCELLVVIINRCTVGANASAWKSLVDALHDDITPTILAPLAGILIVLHSANKSFLSSLVETPGFNLEGFKRLDCSWLFPNVSAATHAEPRIVLLKQALAELESCAESRTLNDSLNDSMELCPICCASALDTSMLPCKHRCCKDCLDRHLQNQKTCFFCKAVITGFQVDEAEPVEIPQS